MARYTVNHFWYNWALLIIQPHVDSFSIGTSVEDPCLPIHSGELSIMLKPLVWERQMETYMQHLRPSAAPSHPDVLASLKLWRHLMYIKVGAAVAGDGPFPMRYDGLWAYFQRVNEVASELLESLYDEELANRPFPSTRPSWMPFSSVDFTTVTGQSRVSRFNFSRHWKRDSGAWARPRLFR